MEISAGELRGYRIASVAAASMVALWGVVHRLLQPATLDPLLPRAGVVVLCLLLLARTWRTRDGRMRLLFQSGMGVTTFWLVDLLQLNHFAPEYAISLLFVLPAISATFPTVRSLVVYLLATNVVVAAVAALMASPLMSPPMVVAGSGATSVVTLLVAIAARRTEAELKQSRERYALAALGANDGLWDWDIVAGRMYFSPRWKSMLGYAEGEVGEALEDWLGRVHPTEVAPLRARLDAHLAGASPHFQREYRIRDARGEWRWMLARGVAVRDAQGRATRMAGSQTDIGAWKEAEARLLHDAFHDPLTDLPNRALFLDRLGRLIERSRRRSQLPFAVLFLDLDRFKIVNDGLGHLVGDELLKIVGRRLMLCVRQEDTVARLGGDEFGILLAEVRGLADATAVAERVNAALQQPVRIGEQEVFTSASIGVALSAAGHTRPDDVLRDADAAMYQAKASGGMRYEVEAGAMKTDALDRLRLESELRRAVERGELRVQYQPLVELESGRLRGLEALLRWQHPERGLLMPDDFLPMAEESGIILALDWWVLYRACEQAARWNGALDAPGNGGVAISVNLSGKHFWQEALVERLDRVLADTGAPASHLRLEILESALMRDAEAAARVLADVRARGIGVAIDDFGTGYSSLSHLQRFQVDALKIDRSFISRLGDDRRSTELVQSVVTLARSLGLDAVAEGVETEDQAAGLRRMGCVLAQGFLFSPPLDADAAGALLRVEAPART